MNENEVGTYCSQSLSLDMLSFAFHMFVRAMILVNGKMYSILFLVCKETYDTNKLKFFMPLQEGNHWHMSSVFFQGCVKVWDISQPGNKSPPISQLDCLVSHFTGIHVARQILKEWTSYFGYWCSIVCFFFFFIYTNSQMWKHNLSWHKGIQFIKTKCF